MKDEFTYYMMANSGMCMDSDEYTYKHHLDDLREYVVCGGRILELEDPFDFPKWLTNEGIPHHFEWIPIKMGEHTMDALFVIHVYDPDQAFDIRMRTNKKPLRPGWRDKWLARGFEACRAGELP